MILRFEGGVVARPRGGADLCLGSGVLSYGVNSGGAGRLDVSGLSFMVAPATLWLALHIAHHQQCLAARMH